MTYYNRASNHFVLYESDNIPNYESRRYGCCKRLLALRTSAIHFSINKKAALSAGTPNAANAK